MLTILIVCAVAGLGAGVVTGFAGLSAAVIISPFLITFLGISPYDAVGIALASDVLASAFSAIIYHKQKNIDIKNSIYMMIAVLAATLIGSYIASFFPQTVMGNVSIYLLILMGLKFIIKPSSEESERNKNRSKVWNIIMAVGSGIWIGLICGITGSGGGMNMLIALTIFMGYSLKKAVGTSVFIMTFTALLGAITHFTVSKVASWPVLILCIIFTAIGAVWSSRYANRTDSVKVNRITGIVMVAAGTIMAIIYAISIL